jgi:hypothetical protein
MPKTHSWYCESKTPDERLHAFCLLRSPYKRSVQYKIQELSDGHGFLNWELMKIDAKTEAEFLENNLEYDTLYVGENKRETVN